MKRLISCCQCFINWQSRFCGSGTWVERHVDAEATTSQTKKEKASRRKGWSHTLPALTNQHSYNLIANDSRSKKINPSNSRLESTKLKVDSLRSLGSLRETSSTIRRGSLPHWVDKYVNLSTHLNVTLIRIMIHLSQKPPFTKQTLLVIETLDVHTNVISNLDGQ